MSDCVDALMDRASGGVSLALESGAPIYPAAPANDVRAPVDIGRGGLPGWRLRRVVDFMTEHLGRDIGVEELVGRCGLSRAQFFRAFRQSTGQTPHRYLVGLRLDRAKRMLESEDLSVGDVARAVGMGANAGFARLFQQRFGVQPARYRRSILAAHARMAGRSMVG